MSSTLRNELLERCQKLPPAQVREVIDFAQFLLTKTAVAKRPRRRKSSRLKSFVGGVNHGTLARNIDHDLYNGAVR